MEFKINPNNAKRLQQTFRCTKPFSIKYTNCRVISKYQYNQIRNNPFSLFRYFIKNYFFKRFRGVFFDTVQDFLSIIKGKTSYLTFLSIRFKFPADRVDFLQKLYNYSKNKNVQISSNIKYNHFLIAIKSLYYTFSSFLIFKKRFYLC